MFGGNNAGEDDRDKEWMQKKFAKQSPVNKSLQKNTLRSLYLLHPMKVQ